jgi:RES domain-containing protein
MQVFRLSREQFASPLSGKGAAIKGARWNPIGVELIYTAQNRSLAMAEVAVHLSLASLPKDFVMVTIDIPVSIKILTLQEADLPKEWNAFPHPNTTQKIGNDFVVENKFAVLQIPSVVTRDECNFLINPYHPDFEKIRIIEMEKFPFDKRMFK